MGSDAGRALKAWHGRQALKVSPLSGYRCIVGLFPLCRYQAEWIAMTADHRDRVQAV